MPDLRFSAAIGLICGAFNRRIGFLILVIALSTRAGRRVQQDKPMFPNVGGGEDRRGRADHQIALAFRGRPPWLQ